MGRLLKRLDCIGIDGPLEDMPKPESIRRYLVEFPFGEASSQGSATYQPVLFYGWIARPSWWYVGRPSASYVQYPSGFSCFAWVSDLDLAVAISRVKHRLVHCFPLASTTIHSARP